MAGRGQGFRVGLVVCCFALLLISCSYCFALCLALRCLASSFCFALLCLAGHGSFFSLICVFVMLFPYRLGLSCFFFFSYACRAPSRRANGRRSLRATVTRPTPPKYPYPEHAYTRWNRPSRASSKTKRKWERKRNTRDETRASRFWAKKMGRKQNLERTTFGTITWLLNDAPRV